VKVQFELTHMVRFLYRGRPKSEYKDIKICVELIRPAVLKMWYAKAFKVVRE